MPLVLLWLVFAILVGFSAKGKGRSFWVWFILSCVISPLITWLILKVIWGD